MEDLLFKIAQKRAELKIPVGDVRQELTDYICGQWPHYCVGLPGPARKPGDIQPPQGKTAFDALVATLVRWLRTPCRELVPQEEAERRAKICSECPLQVSVKAPCGPCAISNKRSFYLVRQGRATKLDIRLKICGRLSQDNQTAVHLPLGHISSQASLPDHCWAKR